MRLPRRITLDMPVAHSSAANTVASLEPRRFGMWSRHASSPWLANCYFAHNSLEFPVLLRFCDSRSGRLFIHFIATLARLLRLGPGGARSIVAQSHLLKHQLLILNRSPQGAPNLSASDPTLPAGWRSGCVPLVCSALPLC